MTASFENPLIPHVRMRALYRGLVELRLFNERLPRTERIPAGLEACWAATALDLLEGDVTTDRAGNALPGFLRGIAARTGAAKKPELQSILTAPVKPFAGTAAERLFCAAGAAMALKAAGNKNTALAYVRDRELAPADWKRVLRVAQNGDLPLVIVTAGAGGVPLSSRAVPVIPVDAADAVAIYRVAQESLLRARAEGGVVVIECVRTRLDPVTLMANQLTAKGIATTVWMAGVESRMRAVLAGI